MRNLEKHFYSWFLAAVIVEDETKYNLIRNYFNDFAVDIDFRARPPYLKLFYVKYKGDMFGF